MLNHTANMSGEETPSFSMEGLVDLDEAEAIANGLIAQMTHGMSSATDILFITVLEGWKIY